MYFYILISIAVFIVCNAAPLLEEKNLYNNGDSASIDEELGEYFEGDMLLSSTQMQQIRAAEVARNGLRGGAKRWPEKTVIYHIEDDDFDDEQVKIIEEGMADIANKSCVKFRARENEEHAVLIQIANPAGWSSDGKWTPSSMDTRNVMGIMNAYRPLKLQDLHCSAETGSNGSANGCFSSVGFSTEQEDGEVHQVLNLAKGCFKHGTVVHEMLHTLGFYHMQSTYDRDDFVEIVWENIKAGTEHNFAKYTNDTVTDFGVQYDYDSVMHYPEHAFSKNGNRTIIPLQANVTIGQRNGLSEKDIKKLNKMYCDASEETATNMD